MNLATYYLAFHFKFAGQGHNIICNSWRRRKEKWWKGIGHGIMLLFDISNIWISKSVHEEITPEIPPKEKAKDPSNIPIFPIIYKLKNLFSQLGLFILQSSSSKPRRNILQLQQKALNLLIWLILVSNFHLSIFISPLLSWGELEEIRTQTMQMSHVYAHIFDILFYSAIQCKILLSFSVFFF